MPASIINGNHSRSLPISDPDLPILATNAAIELDRWLQGKRIETPSVDKLAERIRESFSFDPEDRAQHSLDPTTITILGDAINEIQTPPISNVRDLIHEAVEIAKVLVDKSDAEKARDFCIAFSRLVSAYLRSTYDSRPYHPYSRLI